MWRRQRIASVDVDYNLWDEKKTVLQDFSGINRSCLFAVDVYKEVYSFVSGDFVNLFGFKSSWVKHIEKCGDVLEDFIHPDDREQLIDMQLEHSRFIYSLPEECRNDYRRIYQFRMRNAGGKYVRVASRQQVLLQTGEGKAWIVMGMLEFLPDSSSEGKVKCATQNIKTGDFLYPVEDLPPRFLTAREMEVLLLVRKGFLSKEIAEQLHISIHTVHNHRKNILRKLHADNSLEALELARGMQLLP